MRMLRLRFHAVRDKTDSDPWDVPGGELRDLYASCGVELKIEPGEMLEVNPSFSAGGFEEISGPWQAAGDGVGHVILGTLYEGTSGDPFGIAGRLVDTKTRGAVVIYTASTYFASHTKTRFLQTIAHELGHLFNLGHSHVTPLFTSTMNSASDRGDDTATAWERAHANADDLAQHGTEPFFTPPSSPPACHPLAPEARRRLNTESEDEVRPWGQPFRFPDEGANDQWHYSADLTLEPEADQFVEGGPLVLRLRLRNRTGAFRVVPGHIGVEYDTLLLTIVRPDRSRYRHRARFVACAYRGRILPSGGEIVVPFMTIRGPGGAIFPGPGRYLIQATIPRAGVMTGFVPVEVRARERGPLTEPRFRQFLADGASRGNRHQFRKLEQLLGDGRRLDELTRRYLLLLRSHHEPDPRRSGDYRLQAARGRTAPMAIRHAAALTEFRSLHANQEPRPTALPGAVRRYLEHPDDTHLIKDLEEDKA